MGRARLLPDEFGVVLLQAAKQSGSVEKVEVVRDGRCVPCVVELAQDLAVRQLLPGIRRAEVEELAHQRGFPHLFEGDDVFRDAGLYHGIVDIAEPALLVVFERRSAGIAAEEEEVIEGVAERILAFGEFPMGAPDRFESTGKSLDQASLKEDRRRSGQNHAQVDAAPGIFVPQFLHDGRPLADQLHLVDDE